MANPHTGDIRDRIVSTGWKYADDKPDIPGTWSIFSGSVGNPDYSQHQKNELWYP
jgi:hypothetical protein